MRYDQWCVDDRELALKVIDMWYNPTSNKFLEYAAKPIKNGKLFGTA